jgi:hypothetical protein
MKPSHLSLAFSAFAAISTAPAAAAPPSPSTGGGISEYLARCNREKASEALSSAAKDRLCHLSFGRAIRARPIAQVIIDAAPPGLKRDNATAMQKRLPPVKWEATDKDGQSLAALGGDWYAVRHGLNPVTMFVLMWMGKEEPLFAVPAALRLLGAKVEPIMCQVKPTGLDRVFWLIPPGKPGLFFQIAEEPKNAEGLGGLSMVMNFKDTDRPATPPFTAQARAEGYTYDCPSEF